MILKKNDFLYLSKVDFTITDYKVFFYFLYILKSNEFVCISQQEVANQLKMSRQQVNKAIKNLIEKKMIIKGEPIGIQQTYKVNENFRSENK